jgi:16S rRNA (guanine527-N7)-methyltransferase
VKPVPFIAQKLAKLGFNEAQIVQLDRYEGLIQQWQKAINLVAPSTLKEVWERHILDSAQLWPIIQNLGLPTRIIDLGSGGGLPGLVLAIAGVEQITMVESDARKCVFLREVSRETQLSNVSVINERIEKTSQIKAPIVTARALAPLKQLIAWSEPLLEENGAMIFLKGQDWRKELTELPVGKYQIEAINSLTDPQAKIIIIR